MFIPDDLVWGKESRWCLGEFKTMQTVAYVSIIGGTVILLVIGILFQRWKIDEDEEEETIPTFI